MPFIDRILDADVELGTTLEKAVQTLENKRSELKRDYAFIKELIRKCEEAGVAFAGLIDTYGYTGGLHAIDRSLLPLARKAAGCSISKHFSSAVNAKTVRVFVRVKSGDFKGLEFSYTAPAPKGKKCKVKEVIQEPYKTFELVCEK